MIWPPLVALGLEQVEIIPADNALLTLHFPSYPYSHSLLLLAVWGAIYGWVLRLGTKDSRAWAIGAALVLSHWVLDFVTHRPDMPLYPGGPAFGLGLWYSMPATLIVESIMFAIGLWLYTKTTRARDGIGRWALWSLVAFLSVAYIGSLTAPPVPSVEALYISAIVGSTILLTWAWWADRHREERLRGLQHSMD